MSEYLRDLLDRATRTAGQAAALAIGADMVNALAVDWIDVVGFALGGFVLSALTTIGRRGIFGKASGDEHDVKPTIIGNMR